MKLNKIILIGTAVAGVAVIAMFLGGRHQLALKPAITVVSNEIHPQPEPAQIPVKRVKKSALPVAEQPEPLDSAQMTPIVGGTGDEQLKALVSKELTVDWDDAINHPRLNTAQLSAPQKETINAAPVPVLLPDHPRLLGNAMLTTGPGWYAASMKEDDASVYLSGNAKVVRIPGVEGFEPPTLGDNTLSVNRSEGIVEISFKAFGIYYDLSVECYDHENDLRCTQDDYALQLVEELKLARGDHS